MIRLCVSAGVQLFQESGEEAESMYVTQVQSYYTQDLDNCALQ